MNIIKSEYKIEIWQDTWNGSCWIETRVVTIGAHDMEFLGRAYNPILTRSANGEITLSFEMTTNYFDPITGTKESNYLIPYLYNEAKVKLYCPSRADDVNNGWFDFIIKEIEEDRSNELTFTYNCQYLPINELSKTGQNLVFSFELENATGKIDELAEAILDGTDWEVGTISADLTEATEETLFSYTTVGLLTLTGVATMAGTPTTISGLPVGSSLYIPYSEMINGVTAKQVIYIPPTTDIIFKNGNIITNKLCNYTVTLPSSPNYVPINYRGYRIVYTYQVEWNTDAERYVTVYTHSNSTTYYSYDTSKITDDGPPVVVSTYTQYFHYVGGVYTEDSESIASFLTPNRIANSQKYRTLEEKEKSRFNLLQKVAELFKVWVKFDIYHDADGRITLVNNIPKKQVSFVDTIGTTKQAGFTYGINVTGIQRNVVSTDLATKMFVKMIENENLPNGFCSIGYANENISREEFLINLDYYVQIGLIDYTELIVDLYDIGGAGIGYLTALGEYNEDYMSYNTTVVSLDTKIVLATEAVAVAEEAVIAAQQMVQNLTDGYNNNEGTLDGIDAYNDPNIGIVYASNLLVTNEGLLTAAQQDLAAYEAQLVSVEAAQANIIIQKKALDKEFYTKYSRYIQEGVWTGTDYISDNAYYYDAQNVLLESSRPSISYTIKVVDVSLLTGYEDFYYNPGDVSYIEDVEYFGFTVPDELGNTRPYREEVIISKIEDQLDNPKENTITIQNYQNQFDELFQRLAASVQSYSLNENIYARANNFTSDGEVTFSALQSSLLNNSLILAQSDTESVIIDNLGVRLIDQNNTLNKVRIVSGGVFVSGSVDGNGYPEWKSAITGAGINTNLLLAGRIDVAQINIINGTHRSFSWDSSGLYAFKYVASPYSIDRSTYVRFNQDGIVGMTSMTENFYLGWNGFRLRTDAGAVTINSVDNALKVFSGAIEAVTLGKIGTSTYGLQIKDNSSNIMVQVLSDGTATFVGTVTAKTGYIGGVGGWTIATNHLYSGNVGLYSGTTYKYTTNSTAKNIRIYAGATLAATTDATGVPFVIDEDGRVKMSQAYVSGIVMMNSGSKIGNWNVTTTAIYNLKNTLASTTEGIYIGTDGINVGGATNYFKVTSAGALTATSANISGNITITGGTITWANVNAPTASQVGALPNTTVIPTQYTDAKAVQAWVNSGYKTYINENGVYSGSLTGINVYGANYYSLNGNSQFQLSDEMNGGSYVGAGFTLYRSGGTAAFKVGSYLLNTMFYGYGGNHFLTNTSTSTQPQGVWTFNGSVNNASVNFSSGCVVNFSGAVVSGLTAQFG